MHKSLFILVVLMCGFLFLADAHGQDTPCVCLNDPISYDEIHFQAINDCRNKRPGTIDIGIVDLLVKIEKEYSVPDELRGMLLAAACMESGYNPAAKGDYRMRGKRKKPMAIGILQFWPWAASKKNGRQGIDRTDAATAARFWMDRIQHRVPVMARRCKLRSTKKIWIAAWVTAIRSPKKDGRCYEIPRHYRILRRWHRKIHAVRVQYHLKNHELCDC